MEAFPPRSFALISFPTKNGPSGYEMNKWGSKYRRGINTEALFAPSHITHLCYYFCVGEEKESPAPLVILANHFIPYPQHSISWPVIQGSDRRNGHQNVSWIKKFYNVKPKAKPQCQICYKFFARRSSLIVHMRCHTGEKPFKCGYCSKAFTQSANLVVHQRTHTGEKPYSCCICGKCFSQSSSVTSHMRTHTGERPYKCTKCEMAFAERSTLSKHYRVHAKQKTCNSI